METCLLNPVGYSTSAVSSWGRGEGWRDWGGLCEGRRERGLPESTCRNCPRAHLSTTQQQSLSLSLSLCLSHFLALHFHHFLCLCISLYPFISFPLTLSTPSLHFTSNTTKQITHLSRCASLTVIFTSQQVIGNSSGHWTQGDYLSWKLLIWLKTQINSGEQLKGLCVCVSVCACLACLYNTRFKQVILWETRGFQGKFTKFSVAQALCL